MHRQLNLSLDSEAKSRASPSPRHFARITKWMKEASVASQHLEETEAFQRQLLSVKDTYEKFKELITILDSYSQGLDTAMQRAKAVNGFLVDWSRESCHSPDISMALQMMGSIQSYQSSIMSSFKETVNKAMQESFQSFLQGDYQEFEKSKKQYEKAKLEYEMILTQSNMERDTEAKNAISVYETECQIYDSKTKYNVANEGVADYLIHLQLKKDIVILDSSNALFREMNQLISKNSEFMESNREYMTQLEVQYQQHKMGFSGMKKESSDERSKKLYYQRRSRYHALVQLLSEYNLELIGCMSDITGKEDFLKSSVRVLDGFNISIQVIQSVITSEVQQTSSHTTLFRGNTINTRFINMYCKMVSTKYVSGLLSPIVSTLIESGERSYEMDPSRLEDREAREANTQDLIELIEALIQRIITDECSCPIRLRYVLSCLRSESMKKFPESKLTSVSAFLFLRLIGPALMTPESYGIISSPAPTNIRRALLLITKVLQNLGNRILFGEKEEYMLPMNQVIKKYLDSIQVFLEKISLVPDHSQESCKIISLEEAELDELPSIHRSLVANLAAIEERFLTQNRKDIVQELASKLGSLGRPRP